MGKYIYNYNYSSSVNDFLEYYTLTNPKEKASSHYDSARTLEKMDEVYKSNLIEIRKLAKMYEMFSKADSFKRHFANILKLAEHEDIKPYAERVMAIYGYFKEKEEKNSKKDVEFLLKLENEKYFDDYNYAYYFVNEYVKYNESPRLSDFLDHAGISLPVFNRFLNIIGVFDQDLYAKYEAKVNLNRELRKTGTMSRVDNLTKGIFEQGDAYDEIEYFKNLPFYDDETAKEILEDFGLKNASTFEGKLKNLLVALKPGSAARVLDYIQSNRLFFGLTNQKEKEETLKSVGYSIPEKGIHIGEDDVEYIISFMRQEKIPLLRTTFRVVRDKYISGCLEKPKGKNVH